MCFAHFFEFDSDVALAFFYSELMSWWYSSSESVSCFGGSKKIPSRRGSGDAWETSSSSLG